jgi:hypothetical protein
MPLYGVKLKNNSSGEVRYIGEGAKSKVNAQRLAGRTRKKLRRMGAHHVSVSVVKLQK